MTVTTLGCCEEVAVYNSLHTDVDRSSHKKCYHKTIQVLTYSMCNSPGEKAVWWERLWLYSMLWRMQHTLHMATIKVAYLPFSFMKASCMTMCTVIFLLVYNIVQLL